jgi:hypothetical protein
MNLVFKRNLILVLAVVFLLAFLVLVLGNLPIIPYLL